MAIRPSARGIISAFILPLHGNEFRHEGHERLTGGWRREKSLRDTFPILRLLSLACGDQPVGGNACLLGPLRGDLLALFVISGGVGIALCSLCLFVRDEVERLIVADLRIGDDKGAGSQAEVGDAVLAQGGLEGSLLLGGF